MPADTFSSILGFLTMGTGNDNNAWGDNANASIFTPFEKAIAGSATHAVTGGTLALDGIIPPAGISSAIEMLHVFNGALISNQIVQVPNLSKLWYVKNNCTGAFTLTFKTASGSASAAVPQGGHGVIFCDGANNIFLGLSTALRDVQWLGADGTALLPGVSFSAEPSSGFYRKSAGVTALSILGSEILELSATGVNVINGTFSVGGAQIVPSGSEQAYAGIQLPSGWLWEDGAAYARASVPTLFTALTITATGNTHTSTTLNNLSVDLRGMGLEGSAIEGTNINTGTTIVSIDSAVSLTLSAAATGTTTGITLRVLPWGQGDGSSTFTIPDRRYRTLVGRDDMNNNNAGRSSLYLGKRLKTTGGEETHTLAIAEMPSHQHTGTTGGQSQDHTHTYTSPTTSVQASGGIPNQAAVTTGVTSGSSQDHTHNFTTSLVGGSTAFNVMSPFGITNFIIKT